jgi:hypothetical protein
MSNLNGRALAFGLAMFLLGAGLLLAGQNLIVRYAGGITAIAIGLGALRRGFRLE